MFDEQQRVGIMHAGFSMTALPHKDIPETQWLRRGAGVKLLVESGSDSDLRPIGIPFGFHRPDDPALSSDRGRQNALARDRARPVDEPLAHQQT
jgi:hypothetical protein